MGERGRWRFAHNVLSSYTRFYDLRIKSTEIHNSDHFINPVLSRSFDGEISKRDSRGKAEKRFCEKFEIFANSVHTAYVLSICR